MIWLASALAGLVVGLFYGAIGLRSPAPPLVALLGLAGMLLGEWLAPPALHAIGLGGSEAAQVARDRTGGQRDASGG